MMWGGEEGGIISVTADRPAAVSSLVNLHCQPKVEFIKLCKYQVWMCSYCLKVDLNKIFLSSMFFIANTVNDIYVDIPIVIY